MKASAVALAFALAGLSQETFGRPLLQADPPPERDARTFVSPMGEPFRGDPSPSARWFAGVDADHDGRLTLAEFRADALRFFATLDLDHDREIGPAELDRYEEVVAPEVRSGGDGIGGRPRGDRPAGDGPPSGGRRGGGGRRDRGGGEDGAGATVGAAVEAPQGAARFGYLAFPEPVIAADADMNRGVSEAEFLQAADRRFVLLDSNHDGVITQDELPKLGRPGGRRGPEGSRGANRPDPG